MYLSKSFERCLVFPGIAQLLCRAEEREKCPRTRGWEPYKEMFVLSKARLLVTEVFPPLIQAHFFPDKVIFKRKPYHDFSGTGQ